MNRFLLLGLTLLPLAAGARTNATLPRTEIGIGISKAFDNAYGEASYGGPFRGSLSALRNVGDFQFGLTLEAGQNGAERRYISPGIVANYRYVLGNGYLYGGVMGGYYATRLTQEWMDQTETFKGLSAGAQLGYVYALGKHFALSGELAYRHTSSHGNLGPGEEPDPNVQQAPKSTHWQVDYLPVTVSLRYRF